MALIEIDRSPDARTLRWFAGFWFPAFFVFLGAMLRGWTGAWGPSVVLVAAAGLLGLSGVVWPGFARVLYRGLLGAVYPLGWALSHALMALIYYGVATPTGLLRRLLGRDPLERELEPEAESYWRERRTGDNMPRYFRQF